MKIRELSRHEYVRLADSAAYAAQIRANAR